MNKVRGRALNANAQNTNNYSMWMEPLSHRDYPVTHVVNPTNNALITSNGVKNVVIAQPGITYNNVRLDVSGSVNPTRWTTGQTINTVFLMPGDTGFTHINTTISSGPIASYTYSPKSNNSKIIVEYSALYVDSIGDSGSGTDSFESKITVTVTGVATELARRQQYFRGGDGTSNRSSTLFPIAGAYNNSSLNTVTFNITLSRINGDDTIRFYNASYDACMKITEIAL
jgi:hypothetical protein